MIFMMVFIAGNNSSYIILLGLWVMTMFAFEISGAQFNPALTIAFIFRRDAIKMPRSLGLFYILFQILGAIAGAEIINYLQFGLKVLGYCDGWAFQSLNSEILTTAIFVFVYLIMTDVDTRYTNDKAITCFLIANSYIAARAMFGGSYGNDASCITKNSISSNFAILGTYGTLANPAFAIGLWFTNLLDFNGDNTDFTCLWMYPTWPFLGAILALVFYELIFNKHVQSRAEIVSDAHSEPGDLEE